MNEKKAMKVFLSAFSLKSFIYEKMDNKKQEKNNGYYACCPLCKTMLIQTLTSKIKK